MAGSGWNVATAGAGITVSADNLVASRPDAGGGGIYAAIRGSAGRKKGKRYFEIHAGATCSVGVVDASADLEGALGGGSLPLQWGFRLSDGYLYFNDQGGSGSTSMATGTIAPSVIGILIDFETHKMTVYADGSELFSQALLFAVDTVLYPAVSMGAGTLDVELVTKEPFSHLPATNFVPWDLFDDSILSTISGEMKIDSVPVAREIKAFTYDRLTFEIDNISTQESKPLGQTISDETTGDYEITLRGGYSREVFVVAFDDYGDPFEADVGIAVGERVHPSTPNGYVYQCTGDGDLPSAEPDPWPTDTEASHLVGTASFEAKPFYRPEVHGPILPASVTRQVMAPSKVISAGRQFTAAITDGGGVVAWGKNNYGQTNVPAGAVDVIQVSAGADFSIALKSDGTVIGWGHNNYGQASPPVITDAVAVAAGSDHALALLSDGAVVAWGRNNHGQCDIPASLSAVAIAAAYGSSFVIKADGGVAHWGYSAYSLGSVPSANNFTHIFTSIFTGFAINALGEVSSWGDSADGIRSIPAGFAEAVLVSDGSFSRHALGLRSDGVLFGWGQDTYGQASLPPNLPPVVALAAGEAHSAVVTETGEVICWGLDEQGQLTPPAGLVVKTP